MSNADQRKSPDHRSWWIKFATYMKCRLHEYCTKHKDETSADRAARITTRATVWMAVFTAVLAGVGIGTYFILKSQLQEMHEGGTDTHNLALAAKLDQRAWIGFALVTLETPKVGDFAHASVTYVNTGRTPAKEVAPLTHLKFSPTLIPNEAELLELSKEGGSPVTILGVMYPGMPYPVPIDGRKPINDVDLAAIGDWYTYLWGEVSYSDVFDERHMMEFCAYRKGITGGFLECPFHNQPDYQK